MSPSTDSSPTMRIGQGWDIHALVDGRPLILGGVHIPHPKGLQGHSDADALLHAIIDALLGAARLGDIGRRFPDTDAAFKGIASTQLLARVGALLSDQGWRIGNIDATVIAQTPRLSPHIAAMEECIAGALGIAPSQVNVKAKTAESMGPVGMHQAIEAQAVALLVKA